MTPPDTYLTQLVPVLEQDARIDAAWLAGSYGRGNADRWSDIDLHLLSTTGETELKAELEALLNRVRPLVLFKWLFDGQMVNAMTIDGVRLDVWCHSQPISLDPAKMRLLFDRTGSVRFEATAKPVAPSPEATAGVLRNQIDEFWRCIALLPTVIGRDERIVAWRGLAVEVDLVLDILLRGYKIEREAGVKRFNSLLAPELRAEVERAITVHGFATQDLANSHLALAAIVTHHGPTLAAVWGFDYPIALEQAVRQYVGDELARLGFTRVGEAVA